MKPEISNFIPGLLAETYKYIEVAVGYFITDKQTREFQIKICDGNGKPFIAKLYNVLLAPYLCDQIFSIIMLTNSGHTSFSLNGFAWFSSVIKSRML